MNNKQKIVIATNTVYGTVLLLLFMDWYSCFEIKSQALKSFVYYGLLTGTPLVLLLNSLFLSKGVQKTIGIIVPILLLCFIILHNPVNIIINSGSWKTQTIEYTSRESKNTKIEFQMQDKGAFGYNKRLVKVHYLTPDFMIVHKVQYIKSAEWIKTNEEVNEMEIKFP